MLREFTRTNEEGVKELVGPTPTRRRAPFFPESRGRSVLDPRGRSGTSAPASKSSCRFARWRRRSSGTRARGVRHRNRDGDVIIPRLLWQVPGKDVRSAEERVRARVVRELRLKQASCTPDPDAVVRIPHPWSVACDLTRVRTDGEQVAPELATHCETSTTV